ncbi:MAG: hypothetical protein MHPSP_000922 [Paramarteilia canceri]
MACDCESRLVEDFEEILENLNVESKVEDLEKEGTVRDKIAVIALLASENIFSDKKPLNQLLDLFKNSRPNLLGKIAEYLVDIFLILMSKKQLINKIKQNKNLEKSILRKKISLDQFVAHFQHSHVSDEYYYFISSLERLMSSSLEFLNKKALVSINKILKIHPNCYKKLFTILISKAIDPNFKFSGESISILSQSALKNKNCRKDLSEVLLDFLEKYPNINKKNRFLNILVEIQKIDQDIKFDQIYKRRLKSLLKKSSLSNLDAKTNIYENFEDLTKDVSKTIKFVKNCSLSEFRDILNHINGFIESNDLKQEHEKILTNLLYRVWKLDFIKSNSKDFFMHLTRKIITKPDMEEKLKHLYMKKMLDIALLSSEYTTFESCFSFLKLDGCKTQKCTLYGQSLLNKSFVNLYFKNRKTLKTAYSMNASILMDLCAGSCQTYGKPMPTWLEDENKKLKKNSKVKRTKYAESNSSDSEILDDDFDEMLINDSE